jgi:hypothetical protein
MRFGEDAQAAFRELETNAIAAMRIVVRHGTPQNDVTAGRKPRCRA